MNDLPRYLLVALIIAFLIFVHELGHFLAAKALRIPVKEFALGFGKRLWGFRWGETECRLNALPIGGYCAFLDDAPDGEPLDPQDPKLLRNRPVWQRFLVLSGGVAFNYAFAFVLILGAALTLGFASIRYGELGVGQVMAGQPAARAGFESGDMLLAVESKSFEGPDGFIAAIRARAGQPTHVTIRRGAQTRELLVTPSSQGKIGVAIQPTVVSREFVRPERPLLAALGTQGFMTVQNVDGFVRLFTGRMSVNELGGVVEIGRAGAYVAKHDLRDMVSFTALISIGLAVMNLLPLPALDGGQLVLLILEAIRRKPLPRSIEVPLQTGGLYVLLGLMTLLLIKDLVHPIRYPEPAAPTPSATASPR